MLIFEIFLVFCNVVQNGKLQNFAEDGKFLERSCKKLDSSATYAADSRTNKHTEKKRVTEWSNFVEDTRTAKSHPEELFVFSINFRLFPTDCATLFSRNFQNGLNLVLCNGNQIQNILF